MISKRRTWSTVFITLLILLAGPPLVVLVFGGVMTRVWMVPVYLLECVYVMLPEELFGGDRVASTADWGRAVLTSTIIAFALSFPVTAGIRKLRRNEKGPTNGCTLSADAAEE